MSKGPAVCVTGHRPPGLPGGYSGDPTFNQYMVQLVHNYYDAGYRTFISGGAIGTDQIFANAVIRLKDQVDAELIIAQPFPSQASKWPDKSQKVFELICNRADIVLSVNEDPYSPWKMQERNKWMVDHSLSVLAIWNGKESGGTWNCIQYAINGPNIRKPVMAVNPFTYEVTNL